MSIAQSLASTGTYYGKYFLLEKLATGGMGEVFLARQQGPAGFEKILVVKKILGHLTDNKEFVELFLGEARLAARMNHRNVVQVFELGEHQGSYFIAMEYVAGKSLRDVIDAANNRKERIHPEIARAIAEQICDGASYAHNLTDITGRSLNIIHRDLNPQNVLLSYGGDVKVIDFGIAKSEISTVKTEAGMIKGKFVYMSPEQSQAKHLDRRSDVFAIGITLYEMLSGENPFHKSNVVLTLDAIQRSEPLPVGEWDPSLAPFDPIIAKALAKDRERRYADASEMQEDLRRIVLPRAPERLSAFLGRVFRSQIAAEQKALVDSDSCKITGSRPRAATPAGMALPAAPAVAPEPAAATASTLLLPVRGGNPSTPPRSFPGGLPPPPAGGRSGASTSRPPPRPPPPPPRRPARSAPEALVDAVLPAPAPSAPEAIAIATETTGIDRAAQSGGWSARSDDPDAKTDLTEMMQVGPAPDAGAAQRSEQVDAPMDEIGPARDSPNTDRIQIRPRRRRTGLGTRLSGRAMWMALCGGMLVAVCALAAVVLWAANDDASVPKLHRARLVSATSAAATEPQPRPADPAWQPGPTQAAKDASASEENALSSGKTAPVEKSLATTRSGTIFLAPATLPVRFAGAAVPKAAGPYQLSVTGDAGTVEVGEGRYKVELDFTRIAGALDVRVRTSSPALVWVNRVARGRSPVLGVKLEDSETVLELKKPGEQSRMLLRLRYREN